MTDLLLQYYKYMPKEQKEAYMQQNGTKKVYIWSDEHGGYWKKNCGGYTLHEKDAGVYTLKEAVEASGHCESEKGIVYEFIKAPDTIEISIVLKKINRKKGIVHKTTAFVEDENGKRQIKMSVTVNKSEWLFHVLQGELKGERYIVDLEELTKIFKTIIR